MPGAPQERALRARRWRWAIEARDRIDATVSCIAEMEASIEADLAKLHAEDPDEWARVVAELAGRDPNLIVKGPPR